MGLVELNIKDPPTEVSQVYKNIVPHSTTTIYIVD